ncbi:MAG: hypothetical protein QGI21_06650 [Candidatus Poseidoniaceae archaeon]|jgi:hypothetical protein|nr:hypothetical protein [Candidatus Poseidoniaceae archaeon]
MSEAPLLTMTKLREICHQPKLSVESENLLETLSGLCSFHTCEDLASFLFTEMFRNLVGISDPWIAFEIGVYRDHTKTIEAIPVYDGITIADGTLSGGIPDNIVIVKTEVECSRILSNWHEYVMND